MGATEVGGAKELPSLHAIHNAAHGASPEWEKVFCDALLVLLTKPFPLSDAIRLYVLIARALVHADRPNLARGVYRMVLRRAELFGLWGVIEVILDGLLELHSTAQGTANHNELLAELTGYIPQWPGKIARRGRHVLHILAVPPTA